MCVCVCVCVRACVCVSCFFKSSRGRHSSESHLKLHEKTSSHAHDSPRMVSEDQDERFERVAYECEGEIGTGDGRSRS